jgi:AraC-like DNA-binding protein
VARSLDADLHRVILLRQAKDRLDRTYGEPLDLRALAGQSGYSLYYFVRAFHETYGETPGRYLARRRVERAQELLRSTNLTVTEVCFRIGFSSLGTFSARFKEVVGVSPKAYREEMVRQGGPPRIPGCFVMMWSDGTKGKRDEARRTRDERGERGSSPQPGRSRAPVPAGTVGSAKEEQPT